MKHFFIINPASGNGSYHERLENEIHNICKKNMLDYEIRKTEYRGHAKWLVKSEVAKNGDKQRFYACGGDGTVNEVASGLAELAVIPVGTGNDFVRSFSATGDFLSVDDQLSGECMKVDVVSAGKNIFVNMLNVGFDSAVVSTISHLRYKSRIMRGKFAYIIGVLINFFKMPKTTLRCEFDDGDVVEGRFLLSAFSNGKYYGGGFMAGSRAELDDGILDVLFVRPCSRLTFLTLISKYKKGTLLEDKRSKKYVIFKKCKALKVEFSPDSHVCIDGEIVSEYNFDIEVIPSSLQLSLPRKAQNEYN